MTLLQGNIPAIAYSDFVPKFIGKKNYEYHKSEGNIKAHGTGGNGREVFVDYLSLPPKYKAAVNAAYGFGCEADMWAYLAKAPIRQLIQPDYKAIEYFNSYISPAGNPLSDKHLIEYPNDAAILNAFRYLLNDKQALKRVLNVQISAFWATACNLIDELKADPKYRNSLPTSERRLQPLYKNYIASGYEALISGRYGNTAPKKHTERIEHLIMSLYCRPGAKPYAREVHADFNLFMQGELQLVDTATGELFNPADFTTNGKPISISKTQVWNIINKPINRATADTIRNGSLYNTKTRPIAHRHSPTYSLSKITMDDVQFPVKLKDGEVAVGYRIFDVNSGCIIGVSYAKSQGRESGKDRNLFMTAIRNMFGNIVHHGMGVPAEIEVEHHISNTFKDDLLKEGYLFPFVRFCNPGNPAEKRAEHFIRDFKYRYQKKADWFIGRFYAKLEANRPNMDKAIPKLTYDELLAIDSEMIHDYNHEDHPDHPGKSRWQVLQDNQLPTLSMPNLPVMVRYVGNSTRDAVQIYNNQWFWACGTKYLVPTEVREKLSSKYIMPYWIAVPARYDEFEWKEEAPAEVYIYQNGKYVARCEQVATYNESKAEATEQDVQIRRDQDAYRREFDKQVNERKARLSKIKVEKPGKQIAQKHVQAPVPAEVAEPEQLPTNNLGDADYWQALALENL